MRITHFGHACVLVETGGARVLIDPGTMSDGFAELLGLHGILITHNHLDHFDKSKMRGLMDANPEATLIAERATVDEASELVDRERIRVVSAGETFLVNGIEIAAVGGKHAAIHPDLERTPNIGFFFIESALLHPGDDLTRLDVDVKLLALPVSGPWLSLADTVDYVRAINPPVAFAMHEAALTEPDFWYDTIEALKPAPTTFKVLVRGAPTDL